jgi:hypothetical protein
MAKNWKKFIPQSNQDITQEQSESLNRNSEEDDNLYQRLEGLGLDNAEWKTLMQEREQLEQTLKGLSQADKAANDTSKRYDQLIPSFKEKKETEKKWLANRANLLEKKQQEKLLDKIKAKTTFSEAKKMPRLGTAKTDDEAPRPLKFKDSQELKNKDEDRLRKPKSIPDLKLAELKLPDSDAVKAKWLEKKKEAQLLNAKSKHVQKSLEAKLGEKEATALRMIEKKKEQKDLFNKENRLKALSVIRQAKQKLENAKDAIKRVDEYTSKAKEETKKVEKKLSEVGDFYKKLDDAVKKANNPELSGALEKMNLDSNREQFGSDKLQELNKLKRESEQIKQKIVNPVNKEWEKLNDKRKEIVSRKEQYVKKTQEFLSAGLSNLPDLQKRLEKQKQMLELKREEEKNKQKEASKLQASLERKKEEKSQEKKTQQKKEEERERKREERKSKRNKND